MKAFDVFNRHGRLIDTVFWQDKADGGAPITAYDVEYSLINHDGYPHSIKVVEVRSERRGKY